MMIVATTKTNLFQSLCLCKAHTVFLKCICHEIEDIRITAIRCLQCFWMNTSPAWKLNAGINDFTIDECSGIAEFINYNPMTSAVYHALMDFALGLKVRFSQEFLVFLFLLESLGITWNHLESLGITWNLFQSLSITFNHFQSLSITFNLFQSLSISFSGITFSSTYSHLA